MAKPKMSAEEKAVRDALAVVQADTGLAKAQEIIKTGAVPAATATAKPTYEGMRSQLSEIKDPKVREALEKSFASTDKLTETVTKKYEDLGYTYDPNTNTATPKVNTGGGDTSLNKDAGVNKDAVIDKDTRDAFAIIKGVFLQQLGCILQALRCSQNIVDNDSKVPLLTRTNPLRRKIPRVRLGMQFGLPIHTIPAKRWHLLDYFIRSGVGFGPLPPVKGHRFGIPERAFLLPKLKSPGKKAVQ